MPDNEELIGMWVEAEEKELYHYGTKHHSGRYPWGSGEDPYQHDPGYNDGLKKIWNTPEDFLAATKKMKSEGCTESEIAKFIGFAEGSVEELRTAESVAVNKAREAKRNKVLELQKAGYSGRQIGKQLGINESSVRSLLSEKINSNKNKMYDVANGLKEQVDRLVSEGHKGYIDVGKGTENILGINENLKNRALYILKAEYGYEILGRSVRNATNAKNSTVHEYLCPPGTKEGDIYNASDEDFDFVRADVSDKDDKTISIKPAFQKPPVLERSRVLILGPESSANPEINKYWNNEVNAGPDRDGMIGIRPGAKGLDLDGSNYCQVRIAVTDKEGKPANYLKGMAIYDNRIPPGYDVVFYTHKSEKKADEDIFKPLKYKPGTKEIDWSNPFGSNIKEKGGQHEYYNEETGKWELSFINKKSDEGDWLEWSKKLPAQFLSKQSPKFVKSQLDYSIAEKVDELENINKLDNPIVRYKELVDFAGGCDSNAVSLKAATLPRQKYQVILGVPSLKNGECYATNFNNGEQLALVRFPHTGPFEIPIVTVNNKNEEGKQILGNNSSDCIGINKLTAEKLSGADFDGDTVIAIPLSDKVKVQSRNSLEGFFNYTSKENGKYYDSWADEMDDEYGPIFLLNPDGSVKRDPKTDRKLTVHKYLAKGSSVGKEMGQITNLITDMSLAGATDEEIGRAVKYSMIVIDVPKHQYNFEKAFKQLRIKELKDKYQYREWVDEEGKVHSSTGAATIISQAKGQTSVPEYTHTPKIDPETGKIVNIGQPKMRYNYKTGEWDIPAKKRAQKMAATDDAMTLVHDPSNVIELAYAEYANNLKALANQARKDSLEADQAYVQDRSKRDDYRVEIASIKAKLNEVGKNAPRERKAQLMANLAWAEEKAALESIGEELDSGDIKKRKDALIKQARLAVGAKRYRFNISDREWEAIQAHALTKSDVKALFDKMDPDELHERATPREEFKFTEAKEKKAIAMENNGYTVAEIAEAFGTSTSTIDKFLRERRGK